MNLLKWFFNQKTAVKLILIFGIIGISVVTSGLTGLGLVKTIGNQTKLVYSNSTQELGEVARIRLNFTELRSRIYLVGKYKDEWSVSVISTLTSQLDAKITNLQSKLKLKSARDLYNNWQKARRDILQFIQNPANYYPDQKYEELINAILIAENPLGLVEGDLRNLGLESLAETMKISQAGTTTMWFIVIFSIVIALVLCYLTIRSISSPLFRLRKAMFGLAEGNLQLPKLPEHTLDEIGETTKAYMESIERLQVLILEVREVTTSLTSMVADLVPQVNATGVASQTVSLTMKELAKGTQEQAKAADHVASIIHQVVDRIEHVNKETQLIAEYSSTVIGETKKGEDDADKIIAHVNNLAQATDKATTVIHNLRDHSEQIGEIIKKIQGMTEQTKLLSLNASIEAVRAGEFGRGFSVVAHEVGKLAQLSSDSVLEIESALGSIQALVMEAVNAMEEGAAMASEERHIVAATSNRFNEIFASITKIVEEIQLVAKENADFTQANQTVLEAIDTIVAISEETAASTEEIVATVENQEHNVKEINVGVTLLKDYSKKLEQSVSQFKV